MDTGIRPDTYFGLLDYFLIKRKEKNSDTSRIPPRYLLDTGNQQNRNDLSFPIFCTTYPSLLYCMSSPRCHRQALLAPGNVEGGACACCLQPVSHRCIHPPLTCRSLSATIAGASPASERFSPFSVQVSHGKQNFSFDWEIKHCRNWGTFCSWWSQQCRQVFF